MGWTRKRRPDPSTVLEVPFDTSASRIARHQMVGELQAAGLPQGLVDRAELVLGELVANAIRHGRPTASRTVEVSWSVADGAVVVGVRDAGDAAMLRPGDLSEDSVSGRGLRMVDDLSDTWGVDRSAGLRVAATLRGRPSDVV